MEDSDKKLQFLRNLEKLKASPVKSEDYSSPLEQDVLRAKGGKVEEPKPIRIKGATQKIDTKTGLSQISGDEFTEKINRLRAEKKSAPGMKFAKTKSKLPGLSNMGILSDLVQGDIESASESGIADLLQKAPSTALNLAKKVAPGLKLGAMATPAGLLGTVLSEAVASEKVGEGSDTGMISESEERDVDLVRDISKDDGTMSNTRLKALQRMLNK